MLHCRNQLKLDDNRRAHFWLAAYVFGWLVKTWDRNLRAPKLCWMFFSGCRLTILQRLDQKWEATIFKNNGISSKITEEWKTWWIAELLKHNPKCEHQPEENHWIDIYTNWSRQATICRYRSCHFDPKREKVSNSITAPGVRRKLRVMMYVQVFLSSAIRLHPSWMVARWCGLMSGH